jgi:RHS repeat-associated protein
MGTYTERYVYDAVGNFLQMRHERSDAAAPGWTRRYTYAEASLVEPIKQSNRLSSTIVGNAPAEAYGHDAHGNMLRMPQLQDMQWDFKDQLLLTRRQRVNNGDAEGILHEGERTYYVYDASGQRVRKVTEVSPDRVKDERIYLGGFEIFRKHGGAVGPVDAGTATLERETLHVMDDKRRVALVETRSLDRDGNDRAPPQLIRYQFGNHLGSASLEADEQQQIISYEEYAPYGSSTYQAARSQTEMAKRYRYTGMERDEESGLNYHGARYYAALLGGWTACDPRGLAAGTNGYAYADGNPLQLVDTNGRAPALPPGQQNAFSARGSSARLLTNHELETGFVPQGTARQMVALVGPQIAAPVGLDPTAIRPLPVTGGIGAATARERGPVLEDASRIDFERFVNSIGPFSTSQNKMLNDALAMPVLATAAPTVAVGLGSYATVTGYDALFHGEYDLAMGRFMIGVGLLTAAKAPLEYRAARNAYANVGPLQDRLKAAVIGDKGYLNKQLTISVGVGRTEAGAPVTMVSVNEGAGADITAQVRQLAEREGALFVQGTGHAEQNIYNYARQQGLRELMVDASIPHCGGCTSAGVEAGVQLRNSSRGEYWYRGTKYGVDNYPSPPASAPIDPSASDWLSRHPDIPWE